MAVLTTIVTRLRVGLDVLKRDTHGPGIWIDKIALSMCDEGLFICLIHNQTTKSV